MAGQKRNTQQSQSPTDPVEEEESPFKSAEGRNPREDDDGDEEDDE